MPQNPFLFDIQSGRDNMEKKSKILNQLGVYLTKKSFFLFFLQTTFLIYCNRFIDLFMHSLAKGVSPIYVCECDKKQKRKRKKKKGIHDILWGLVNKVAAILTGQVVIVLHAINNNNIERLVEKEKNIYIYIGLHYVLPFTFFALLYIRSPALINLILDIQISATKASPGFLSHFTLHFICLISTTANSNVASFILVMRYVII